MPDQDDARNDLFKVVERMPDGTLDDDLTTGPYHGRNTWNNKIRVYPKLHTARTYRDRVRAQGRDAVIVRYVATDEVE